MDKKLRSQKVVLIRDMEYWDECIDPTFKPVDLSTEVVLIPDKLLKAMDF